MGGEPNEICIICCPQDFALFSLTTVEVSVLSVSVSAVFMFLSLCLCSVSHPVSK